jgi:hypothetical protein
LVDDVLEISMSILQHFGRDALVHYKLPYFEELNEYMLPAIIISSKKLAIHQKYLTKQDIPHLLATNQSIRRIIPTPFVEHTIANEYRPGFLHQSNEDLKAKAIQEAIHLGHPVEPTSYGPVKFEIRHEIYPIRWSLVYCYRYKAFNNRTIFCQIFNRTAKFQLFISDDNHDMEFSDTTYEFEKAVQKIESYLGAQGVCVKLR